MKPSHWIMGIAFFALTLKAPAAAQAGGADKKEKPPPVEDLQKGLMTALGDAFDFKGGEVGRTKGRAGSFAAERFWFANVQPKTAGEFSLAYTILFDFPEETKKAGRLPEKAVYFLPIKIGERGAPRLIQPSGFGGSAWPHANVGDTLVIPIHVDWFVTGHVFTAADKGLPEAKAFFSVAGERVHERYMKLAAAKPVVRNDAAEPLELLASWRSSVTNRPGTATSHELSAYLEFKKPGDFNLAGRLVDAEDKAAGAGTALRVVAKDEPVTVVLEYFGHKQQRGKSTSTSSGGVKPGTLQARVGDRVVIGAGRYATTGIGKVEAHRSGVVLALPFKGSEAFTVEK